MSSMHENKTVTVTITPGTIVITILSLLLVGMLYVLRDLVMVVLTAIVIASAVEPVTNYFKRFSVPRVMSVLGVYILILGTLFTLFYFFVPPLLKETSGFVSSVPQLLSSLSSAPLGQEQIVESVNATHTFLESLREVRSIFTTSPEGIFNTINVVFGGVLSFMLIIVLSFYFAVQEQGIDDFLRLVSPIKHQKYVLNLWQRSQRKIGRWMQGQILLSLIVGLLVYLGLSILGVPYALLLAIIAGVLELIPVFGSIVAAVPAVAIAFATGGTGLALFVIGFYIIVNQFQANLVYPLVVQKIVGVPPLLVILALIIGWNLAGFLGIVLSVPAAAILREYVNDVQKEKDDRMRRAESNELLSDA